MKIDEISKAVSKKIGVNEFIVREINRSQWKFLFETMQIKPCQAVKMMYIGKFSEKKKIPWESPKLKKLLIDKGIIDG